MYVYIYIYIYMCTLHVCICMSYIGVRDVSSFWCSEDMWRCNVFKISKLWFRCITCWKTGDSVLALTPTSNSNLCAGHGEAQPSEWLKLRFSNPTLAGVDCHDSIVTLTSWFWWFWFHSTDRRQRCLCKERSRVSGGDSRISRATTASFGFAIEWPSRALADSSGDEFL